ncbi:unnamed protein product [Amoebophrya sp. A25]|nr:unnamed protein product [Amoebophrya sp. A25]|eukprot:GSA25T00006809001.1
MTSSKTTKAAPADVLDGGYNYYNYNTERPSSTPAVEKEVVLQPRQKKDKDYYVSTSTAGISTTGTRYHENVEQEQQGTTVEEVLQQRYKKNQSYYVSTSKNEQPGHVEDDMLEHREKKDHDYYISTKTNSWHQHDQAGSPPETTVTSFSWAPTGKEVIFLEDGGKSEQEHEAHASNVVRMQTRAHTREILTDNSSMQFNG